MLGGVVPHGRAFPIPVPTLGGAPTRMGNPLMAPSEFSSLRFSLAHSVAEVEGQDAREAGAECKARERARTATASAIGRVSADTTSDSTSSARSVVPPEKRARGRVGQIYF